VGDRWPGIYQRVNRLGERVLEFDYQDETGRRRWHTLPVGTTLKTATTERERYRVRRADGERFAPAQAPRLGEVWAQWLEEASVALRPRTITAYEHAFRYRISPRLGRVKLSQLDRRHVIELIRHMQREGKASWTIRGTLTPLGRFLDWAADQGFCSGNPVHELRRRERPKVARKEHRLLTADDLWALVNAAAPERKAFVALLAFAGLRLSECLGLTWQDVDLHERVLHVRFQLERETLERTRPKTEQGRRTIEMTDELVSILRTWKAASPFSQDQHFVVTTKTGKPLEHHQAGRRLQTIVRAAGLDVEGLPKITPHQLRSSFGSLLIDAGEATSRVSRLLGHADEAITGRIYTHEIQRRDNAARTRETMARAFAVGS
jgi:integrase